MYYFDNGANYNLTGMLQITWPHGTLLLGI